MSLIRGTRLPQAEKWPTAPPMLRCPDC